MAKTIIGDKIMEKINVTGINISNVTLDEAVESVINFAKQDNPSIVVTPNAEFAKNAIDNRDFMDLLNKADLVIPDGAGIILAAKILGKPLKGKVAGVDLAAALLPQIEKEGLSLFLFGSEPGVAEKAAENIKKKYPSIKIAGTLNGFFKDDSDVVPIIRNSNADVLFVCLGSPKQEYFMFNNKDKLNVKVMLGLGGSINIFAGVAKRAPEFFIKYHLEWFYRLIKEPSRIGRMMKLPLYIWDTFLIKYKLKKI